VVVNHFTRSWPKHALGANKEGGNKAPHGEGQRFQGGKEERKRAFRRTTRAVQGRGPQNSGTGSRPKRRQHGWFVGTPSLPSRWSWLVRKSGKVCDSPACFSVLGVVGGRGGEASPTANPMGRHHSPGLLEIGWFGAAAWHPGGHGGAARWRFSSSTSSHTRT